METIKTQDVWVKCEGTFDGKTVGFLYRDRKQLLAEILEKKSNMVCLSLEDFEKAIGHAIKHGAGYFDLLKVFPNDEHINKYLESIFNQD